jgi:hypothetical protein
MLLSETAALRRQCIAQRRIIHYAIDRARKIRRRVRWNEKPAAFVLHDLGNTADRCRNDGPLR